MFLELCGSGPLLSTLAKLPQFGEGLVAGLFVQLMQAVQYCHALGIAHRDIKPEVCILEAFILPGLGCFFTHSGLGFHIKCATKPRDQHQACMDDDTHCPWGINGALMP